jgi:hypothetical protein
MMADSGEGWTDPRYIDVVKHITNHSEGSDHRRRRHPRPAFGGTPAFVVDQGDVRTVHCCGCLQVS